MKRERNLVLLNHNAVDAAGKPNPFLKQELPWLTRHFDRVWLVCERGVKELTGMDTAVSSVDVAGSSPWDWAVAFFRALFAGEGYRELHRMWSDKQFTLGRALRLFRFAMRGQRLYGWTEALLRRKENTEADVTLYAYWMYCDAYAGALCKAKHSGVRFVARGHAFDIDLERNPLNPYLMKRFIAAQAGGLYLISQYALSRYLQYMQGAAIWEKLHVVGVGSAGEPISNIGQPPMFTEGELSIVSCAAISEIKRLPLLVDALSGWDGIPVRWLHMGGGPDEEDVRMYARQKLEGKANVTFTITGSISQEEVQQTYQNQAFDVFMNTSRMEGVPVSIMEAMRFGIPIIAPRVGGIPELVDDSMGILFDPQGGAEGIREALVQFAALSQEMAVSMRKASQAKWNGSCQCRVLLPQILGNEAQEEVSTDG